jgi:hypothetical protein
MKRSGVAAKPDEVEMERSGVAAKTDEVEMEAV